jgi:hypothetical protein
MATTTAATELPTPSYATTYTTYAAAWADFNTYTALADHYRAAARRARSEQRWADLSAEAKHYQEWATFANLEACALVFQRD